MRLFSGAEDGADTVFGFWSLFATWMLWHIHLTKRKRKEELLGLWLDLFMADTSCQAKAKSPCSVADR